MWDEVAFILAFSNVHHKCRLSENNRKRCVHVILPTMGLQLVGVIRSLKSVRNKDQEKKKKKKKQRFKRALHSATPDGT